MRSDFAPCILRWQCLQYNNVLIYSTRSVNIYRYLTHHVRIEHVAKLFTEVVGVRCPFRAAQETIVGPCFDQDFAKRLERGLATMVQIAFEHLHQLGVPPENIEAAHVIGTGRCPSTCSPRHQTKLWWTNTWVILTGHQGKSNGCQNITKNNVSSSNQIQ